MPREAWKLHLTACTHQLNSWILPLQVASGREKLADGSECKAGKKPLLLPANNNQHRLTVFHCQDTRISYLDDGVADAPCLLAEHTVFEGLVHYNIGHFIQVHAAGVCREEKRCQDPAHFVPCLLLGA